MESPLPIHNNEMRFTPRRTVGYYFLAVVLLLALLISLIILLPQVRQFILSMYEQHIKHDRIVARIAWMRSLFHLGITGSVFTISLGFLLLTPPGRKLINKTESEDEINSRIHIDMNILRNILFSEKFFLGFAFFSSFVVFSLALFRAANTGITHDEAYTYINYVLPNIFDSLSKGQALNNHFLNSFCIRVVNFFSQSKYNELIIRFPNLVFYCIFLFFSYLIAKQYKNRFLIFVLFISNYCLNEFFGLARGYGMACACITAACYFFEKWKSAYKSKKSDYLFFLFLLSCSLAALSNSITLFLILCFFILINFKYKKDLFRLSYLPFFVVFILTGLYTILVSLTNAYSTFSFYLYIMSIPDMFSSSKYLSFLIALLFLLSFIYLMIRTKGKDDYCWILAIFAIICIMMVTTLN